MLDKVVHGLELVGGLAWRDSDTLLGFQVGADHRPPLVAIRVSDGRERPVALPDEAIFASAGERRRSGWEYTGTPVVLPDGRIGLRRTFFDQTTPVPGAHPEYVAVDLAANRAEAILSLDQLQTDPLLLRDFVWNHDLSEVYAELRHPLEDTCSTIVHLTRGGLEPLSLRVGDAATGWDLGVAANTMNNQDCDPQTGTARLLPSMERDARSVAFFATPTPSERRRSDSTPTPTVGNIYSTRFGSKTAEVLVRDAVVVGAALSPDGTRLAWNGRTLDGKLGCWILDLEHQDTTIVATDFFGSLAWSPDGRGLAALNVDGDTTIFRAS